MKVSICSRVFINYLEGKTWVKKEDLREPNRKVKRKVPENRESLKPFTNIVIHQ